MGESAMVQCLNEWMRRYTDEPERFEREITVVRKFLAERDSNEEKPSYGRECAAYMVKLGQELGLTQ
jgi:hypothetical protein